MHSSTSTSAATTLFPSNSHRQTPSLRTMSSTASFASALSNESTTPFSLNSRLVPGATFFGDSRPMSRAHSISSASASSTCSYSREELERERELFGESAMGLFEPRDRVVGFWGLTEVLRGENQ